jgi:ATPase subunit of ABC transporter with duplicated ATPase domains
VWVLHNTHIVDFAGSFSEWEQVSEARSQAAAVNASEEVSLRRMHEKQKIRRAQKEKEGTKQAQRDARLRASDAEKLVLSLESEVAKISGALADPELYLTRDGAIRSANLGKDLERLKKKLDKALEAWAQATEATTS